MDYYDRFCESPAVYPGPGMLLRAQRALKPKGTLARFPPLLIRPSLNHEWHYLTWKRMAPDCDVREGMNKLNIELDIMSQ